MCRACPFPSAASACRPEHRIPGMRGRTDIATTSRPGRLASGPGFRPSPSEEAGYGPFRVGAWGDALFDPGYAGRDLARSAWLLSTQASKGMSREMNPPEISAPFKRT